MTCRSCQTKKRRSAIRRSGQDNGAFDFRIVVHGPIVQSAGIKALELRDGRGVAEGSYRIRNADYLAHRRFPADRTKGIRFVKFGIIIPTYNRAQVLPRAIRSVLDQDYADWALYIVNDGSRDETESVVEPFLSDPRVRLLNNHANRGKLHSVNVALDQIESDGLDWFTWMDDDDQLTSDCLSVARGEIERHPGFGMFLFSTVDTDGKSLARMRVSGPANYLREKLLRKRVAGETHKFVATPYLNGTRLDPSSFGVQKFWFGELSLRTGAVFCDRPTKIRRFPDAGITMQHRRNRRSRDEREVRLDTYLLRFWDSVIYRHPFSFFSYLVRGRVFRPMSVRRFRLHFGPIRNEPRKGRRTDLARRADFLERESVPC